MSILYFCLVLGVLILVHEWGHFLMARRAGIRVETFAIGFGPRLVGFRRGDTEFRIGCVPLGGFVKMVGEDPGDERAGDPAAFTAQSVGARLKVVTAGPIMNLCLAAVLLPIAYWIGRSEPAYLSQPARIERVRAGSPADAAGLHVGERIIALDGRAVATWEEAMDTLLLFSGTRLTVRLAGEEAPREVALTIPADAERLGLMGVEPLLFQGNDPVIDALVPGGVAAEAGFLPRDRVIAVGDLPITDWPEMADAVHRSGGSTVVLTVERGRQHFAIPVTPQWNAELKRYVIGVQKDPSRSRVPTVVRSYGLISGVVRGERELWRLAQLTVRFLGRLFTAPRVHYRSLGGPVQIARASMAAAKEGLTSLLYFAAFLSLQLGLLNLLPIPVLDGGHLLFLGIEAVRRRPLSMRARLAAQQIGLTVLLGLLVIVTYNDLDHLMGIRRWVERAVEWMHR